tara:strand:+ start:1187 stop:1486 length:300 start_codon:yes stop_codon:yes gene_type:complete
MDTTFTSNDILDIVKDIQSNITLIKDPVKLRELMKEKYPVFAEKYISLFEMSLKPNIDMNSLRYMLKSRDKIIQGRETVEEMSKEIGWKFWNKYQSDKK